jgi:hypothetical protein
MTNDFPIPLSREKQWQQNNHSMNGCCLEANRVEVRRLNWLLLLLLFDEINVGAWSNGGDIGLKNSCGRQPYQRSHSDISHSISSSFLLTY